MFFMISSRLFPNFGFFGDFWEMGGGRGGGATAMEVWHAAQLKNMGARSVQTRSMAKTY
jgi:hypothetical protein